MLQVTISCRAEGGVEPSSPACKGGRRLNVGVRVRWPLRCAVRASVRSCKLAPIASVSSASINVCRSSPQRYGHDHQHR